MSNDRYLGALLICAAVATAGACQEETTTPLLSSELESMQADQVMFDVLTKISVEGVREAQVEADTAYLWRDSTSVSLSRVRMTLFDEVGRERAIVTSDSGVLDERTQKMIARGNVVLLVDDGSRKIESAEIHYEPQINKIWSDSTTVMTEANRVVEGSAFESDVDFLNVIIRDSRTRGSVVF